MAMIGRIWLSRSLLDDVAAETGRHRTTVFRWLQRGAMPHAESRLLDITHNGNLGEIHAAWEGWTMDTKSGDLLTPAGDRFSPGHIASIPYRMHQLAHLERKLNRKSHATDQGINARVQRL